MSATQTPILQAKGRAKDYWGIDGLPTVFQGLSWLVLAAIWSYRPGTINTVLLLCIVAIFPWIAFRETQIIKRLKARYTYPRSGFVEPPEPDLPSSLVSLSINKMPTPEEAEVQSLPQDSKLDSMMRLLSRIQKLDFQSLFVSTLIIELVIGSSGPQAAVMVLMGIGSLGDLRKNRLAWVDALVLVAAGLAIALLPTNFGDRVKLMFLTPGILFTVRGAITFLRYLRRNPVQA